ncbi:MAG: recombinase family protein [Lachnospiraceae bacterium]|nr:recombinase family protein [Lachnospiraceae bacterium]
MLKNRKYIGVYTYDNKIAIEGECPAIIDREEFETVQNILETTKSPYKSRS